MATGDAVVLEGGVKAVDVGPCPSCRGSGGGSGACGDLPDGCPCIDCRGSGRALEPALMDGPFRVRATDLRRRFPYEIHDSRKAVPDSCRAVYRRNEEGKALRICRLLNVLAVAAPSGPPPREASPGPGASEKRPSPKEESSWVEEMMTMLGEVADLPDDQLPPTLLKWRKEVKAAERKRRDEEVTYDDVLRGLVARLRTLNELQRLAAPLLKVMPVAAAVREGADPEGLASALIAAWGEVEPVLVELGRPGGLGRFHALADAEGRIDG